MSYLLLIVGAAILLGAFLFNGMVKGTGKIFSLGPSASETYQGSSTREKSSEQAQETYDKNRRLMDDMKDKLDRRRNNY